VRERRPLCFPSSLVLVRAGQESSDRTEPVPPERESLTPEERPKAYTGNFNGFTNYGVGIGLRVPH
jgi:hypothetical protein